MDGIADFSTAKRKAARQMGVTERGALPDNLEIEAALKVQQAVFQSNSQPQECLRLRRAAVAVMRRLDRFAPWLVGGVLSGTANRFSPIELEVIADDAKQLELFLVNERIPFKTRVHRAARLQRGEAFNEITTYEISFDDFPIVVAVYPCHAARLAHHPKQSLKHVRADLADVESLIGS